MSDEKRLNPDELLTALEHREAAERRGRLKIFFGAAAGVGKTYTMLESARAMRATGIDLVIGYVVESLNDVVANITGVRQRETIPDRVFDQAEDVELIDLPPSDLLARLRAGKVYSVTHATAATKRYFREPNLLALRELALRRTADRVDAAARAYKDQERFSRPWLARDRFLVAVALDDQAEQLIRVGKRFADALDAEWLVVTVETNIRKVPR
jgi:K+-sensing histidine kinase KdpD